MNEPGKGRIIHVRVTEGKAGLFFAESAELKGLLVASLDMDSLWQKVPEAIRGLYAAAGQTVLVTSVEDNTPDTYPFAAIPVHLLKDDLKRTGQQIY